MYLDELYAISTLDIPQEHADYKACNKHYHQICGFDILFVGPIFMYSTGQLGPGTGSQLHQYIGQISQLAQASQKINEVNISSLSSLGITKPAAKYQKSPIHRMCQVS